MNYKVVISGNEIFFENYDHPEPVIGFISCRVIRAHAEDLAIAMAKRDILVGWNQSFNADRKLGLPQLVVEYIAPTKPWFKPKIQHDYYWFTSDEHKRHQLDKFTRKPSWMFWRK
jgi:hypothetical protein